MRYYLRNSTLFVRGEFTAASTGVRGGVGPADTLFNHTVAKDWDHRDPSRYLERIMAREGLGPRFYGLLTAVEMKNLCILQYDFITAFITAGVTNPNPEPPHTINILLYSSQGLTDGARLEAIITATEAKARALQIMGFPFTGTTTDAVIVASEGPSVHEYSGTLTEAGKRIYAAVTHGVEQALRRQRGEIQRTAPSFFIYSRYGGNHWVEWEPDRCRYYPCHFEGQRCDFCYCPLYPCQDEELGAWVESSQGGKVWSCSRCRMIHEPAVTEYLHRNPEATLEELKAFWARYKRECGSPAGT